MSKGQRFEKIYTQGAMTTTDIWVDSVTGLEPVAPTKQNFA